MQREMLVKIATVTLAEHGVSQPQAEALAEAIAQRIDLFATVLGNSPTGAVPPPAPAPQRPAFPSFNPEAVAPVVEEPQSAYTLPPPEERRIQLASSIPDKVERTEPVQAAVTVGAPKGAKLKVEELNQLIQDRTPEFVSFDVPMGNGTTRRCTWKRDVLSRHVEECVQVVLYPPNATISQREAVEVSVSLHIDDAPFDLSALMRKLVQEAIESARPRPAPGQLPVVTNPGPVTHAADAANTSADIAQQTQGLLNQTRAIFGGMG